MTSTYVNDLRLNEMATGDASGSWGTVTNTNLELIGEALGYGTEAITTNADTHASVIADGATDPVRALYVEYTGTLDSACTITISPNTVNKVCFIENGTAGSQNIIISQGSGANVTIPPGDTKAVYLNGAGSGAAVVDAFASLSVVDLNVSGNLDVDGTANLDAVDIDGAVQIDNTVSVGVDDTGYDVKFFGDTASAYMLWDASADDLILGGAAGLSVNSTALVTGVLTTTAATVFNGGFAAGGVGTFADGSAGAPSITNTGDLDTGIAFPAADSFAISTAGTQRLLINSAGFFDVAATGNDVARFSGANSGSLVIRNDTANQVIMHTSTSDSLVLGTGGNNDRLTIDANGLTSFNGIVDILNTTDATATTDGALIVDGGVGIAKKLYVGTDITMQTGTAVFQNLDEAPLILISGTVGDKELIDFQRQGGAASGSLTYHQSPLGFSMGDDGGHTFRLKAGGTDRLTVQTTSGNNVVIADGLTLTDGNLIVAAGHGIDFSAQTATSASGASTVSELLDHYEEGTWTVTLAPGSGFTPSSNTSTGYYTRIGRQVTVTGYAVMTTPASLGTWSNNSTSANLVVTTLPFTTGNALGFRSAPVIGVSDNIAVVDGYLSGHGNENGTSISIFQTKDNGGTRSSPTLSTSSAINFHFSFTYFV